MMKIRFFYDYECPFCKNAYEDLMDLLPSHPNSEIDWRPVEAHPRPEKSWLHTDLCIEAFYTAIELGADMDAVKRLNIPGQSPDFPGLSCIDDYNSVFL